jgi:hypothetical protein
VLTTSVAQAATRTKLTISSATPQFGEAITLTATLCPVAPGAGIPGGTVTFLDGSAVLGTATLVDGVASLSTSVLKLGAHTIAAVYSGDDSFLTSTSQALSATVVQAQVNVQLGASATSITAGTSITFSITVVPVNTGTAAPSGRVTLYDGSLVIGQLILANGLPPLTLSTSTLSKGKHTITASYNGDADFLGAISSAVIVTIG